MVKKRIHYWTAILITILICIVVAALGMTYLLGRYESRQNDLENQITKLQKSADDAETDAAEAAKEEEEASSWKNYTNDKYSFALTFNDVWKNFEVVEKTSDDANAVAYLYICVPTTDAGWQDEKANMFCPFAITVVEIAKKTAFETGSAPLTPTYIDSNSKYAFYYSMSQAQPADGETARNDAKNIIDTFKAN